MKEKHTFIRRKERVMEKQELKERVMINKDWPEGEVLSLLEIGRSHFCL